MTMTVASPYLIIVFGVFLAYLGIRPRMLAWAVAMSGGLLSLGVSVYLFYSKTDAILPLGLIAITPFLFIVSNIVNDLRHPRINDVSTDVERPPAFVGACGVSPNTHRDMSFPEKNGAIIQKGYPDLAPLYLKRPTPEVVDQILALMRRRPGWIITRVDRPKGCIEGAVTTSTLRFVDDLIIRVEQMEHITRVDMRSKSREGLVDGGFNARRIRTFFESLASEFN